MAADISPSGATSQLSAFVHGLTIDAIAPAALHEARRAFVNIVGCCVGGAHHDIVEIACRALLPLGGAGTTALIGRDARTDILTAAMINCLSSFAYAFDDTHAETMLHPSGAVATTLLALADTHRLRGDAFMIAFIAGIEVASRASKAVATAPAVGDIGWSQTGLAAGMGAAAAAARVMGLDTDGIARAIGLAAVQSSGLRIAHGTMASTFIVGHAGQSGLRAALLAKAGMGAPVAALEGAHGFAGLFASRPHPAYLTDGLGIRFEVESLTYKPYPFGIVVHPVIDAALAWLQQASSPIEHIRDITLHVHANAFALGARRHPSTALEAKVSLAHGAAVALVFGRAGLAEVDDPAIRDARVTLLRERTTLHADPGIPAEAARMAITLVDGNRQVIDIAQCRGSIANPMSDADLTAKFLGQAHPWLSAERAKALADACWRVDRLDDVTQLTDRLHA